MLRPFVTPFPFVVVYPRHEPVLTWCDEVEGGHSFFAAADACVMDDSLALGMSISRHGVGDCCGARSALRLQAQGAK